MNLVLLTKISSETNAHMNVAPDNFYFSSSMRSVVKTETDYPSDVGLSTTNGYIETA